MKQTYTTDRDEELLEEAYDLLVTLMSALSHFMVRTSNLAEKIRRKDE